MSNEVVVVGAGPGGLATAMLLAKAGAKVRVLERLPFVGGRTSTFEAEGGYRFDLGPTFFHYPRILAEIFASVGRDLGSEVPFVRLDPQYRIVFGGGGRIDTTTDVERMDRAVCALSPQDRGAFARFMNDNRRKLELCRSVLESPQGGVLDALRGGILKMLPVMRPHASLADELGRYFKDPRLQIAFTFQAKYLGMSPASAPSFFSIVPYLEYEYGIFHPLGGFGRITEAMARVARDLGAQIHLEEPVEELLFEGRRVVGARTPRGEYRADAVVLNADFARGVQRLVPPHLRRSWSDRRLEKSRYSCSTFMMYLGVEGRLDELSHHTIYIADDYAKNLDDIERTHRLSEDPSFYVQNAGVTDASLAPPGHSSLYVLVPVSHQHPNIDWSRDKAGFRQRVLAQLGKVGLHGLESRIRYERVVTPDDWSSQYEVHKGAVFNLAHSLGQMLLRRPHNRFDDVDRLYLVGGGTHPGSGLPVIFESARISSRLLAADLGFDMPATVTLDGRKVSDRLAASAVSGTASEVAA